MTGEPVTGDSVTGGPVTRDSVDGASVTGPGPSVRVPPGDRRSLGPLARLTAVGAARVTGATGGEPLRVFTTLGRHRRLFRAWLRFGAALLLRGELPAADRELVVLRTAWRCGAWYVWVQHVALASGTGPAALDLERITADPEAAGWPRRQRLLVRAVDELVDRHVIGDTTWRGLAGELGERELIELCLLVGHYEMLAGALNSLGVEPEPVAAAGVRGGAAAVSERLRDRLVALRRG